MKTQDDIEGLFIGLYQELGGDPTDLIQIRPRDGGWGIALSYEVIRKDGKSTTINRHDLDDDNYQNMKQALKMYS